MLQVFGRNKSKVGIVIITGSCCMPGMATLEEKVRLVVNEAVSETGVEAQVREVPASNAMFGAVPLRVRSKLMAEFNSGQMPLPAVLVDGQIVSHGVPDFEKIKSALRQSVERDNK